MKEETKTIIHACYELYRAGISPEIIAPQLGIHRATVYRWIKGIELKGVRKFIRDFDQAQQGHRHSNKTDPLIKHYIYQIREDYHNCCGEKIQYFLHKNYGITIS